MKLFRSTGVPLAMYVFSQNQKLIDKFLDGTCSGGCCINDILMHGSSKTCCVEFVFDIVVFFYLQVCRLACVINKLWQNLHPHKYHWKPKCSPEKETS